MAAAHRHPFWHAHSACKHTRSPPSHTQKALPRAALPCQLPSDGLSSDLLKSLVQLCVCVCSGYMLFVLYVYWHLIIFFHVSIQLIILSFLNIIHQTFLDILIMHFHWVFCIPPCSVLLFWSLQVISNTYLYLSLTKETKMHFLTRLKYAYFRILKLLMSVKLAKKPFQIQFHINSSYKALTNLRFKMHFKLLFFFNFTCILSR